MDFNASTFMFLIIFLLNVGLFDRMRRIELQIDNFNKDLRQLQGEIKEISGEHKLAMSTGFHKN
jgi:hypothetical protein